MPSVWDLIITRTLSLLRETIGSATDLIVKRGKNNFPNLT
jgi:hypothetical protein